MTGDASVCWHCGEVLPAGSFATNIGGSERMFCCSGCVAAARWIDQLGLLRYRSATPSSEPRFTIDASVWTRPDVVARFVRDLGGGRREAVMFVEGLRCAGCVWHIEHALQQLDGVVSVGVNAGACRARVAWTEGMTDIAAIVEALSRIGYRGIPVDASAVGEARRREARDAAKRLGVAGIGAMQAMMYALVLYLGADAQMDSTTRDLFRSIGLLVATPVVCYSAQPFFRGAWQSVRARHLGVDIPVALAIALTYAASIVQTWRGTGEVYFDSVSMFVFFLLAGRFLEMRARHRSSDLVDALVPARPRFAHRLRQDGSTEVVAALELRGGDRIHVHEGDVVPADGVLESGRCTVDESVLSGESVALTRACGDTLLAGALLIEGPARLRVVHSGNATRLAGIARLVERAQSERPRLALAGERAAGRLVTRVLALASVTGVCWLFVEPARAFDAVVAVLVVSCPCAFALAVPAAIARALAVLVKGNVVVVRPDAIAALASATRAVFDKTGTLTEPYLPIDSTCAESGVESADALALAGALARQSRHPIARAIAALVPAAPTADEVEVVAGQGIRGVVNGRALRLGRRSFALEMSDCGEGEPIVLADDLGILATFHLRERIRAGARNAVQSLQAQGVGVEIVSGDDADKVARIADDLGVATWTARATPEDKLARLNQLRSRDACVMAVGDGINDAPVLGGADVAIALASGADLAQVTSDIVLCDESLERLPWARDIAQQALAVIRQNERWALCYNVAAIPLAAFGLVSPWLAAIGMSCSSLVVVLNALRIGARARATHQGAGTLTEPAGAT